MHNQGPVRQGPQGSFAYVHLCQWCGLSDGVSLLGSSLWRVNPSAGSVRIALVVSLVDESQLRGNCIHGGLVI